MILSLKPMQKGNVRLKVTVMGDESGRPKIEDISAAQLSFDSLSIVTSGAKLSWLYNAVAALAHTQIQEAITKAVSRQVQLAHIILYLSCTSVSRRDLETCAPECDNP